MFCYAWFYLHRSLVIYDIGYFEQFKIWLHKGVGALFVPSEAANQLTSC